MHPCLRLFRVRLRRFRSARSFSGATRTKRFSPSAPAAFLERACSPRVRLRLSPKRQKHPIVRRCRNMRLPAEMCAHRRRNIRLPGRDMRPPTSEHVSADVGICAPRGLPAPAVRNRLHGIIFRFLIAVPVEIDSRGPIPLNEEPSARSFYRLSSSGKKAVCKTPGRMVLICWVAKPVSRGGGDAYWNSPKCGKGTFSNARHDVVS